MASSQILIIFFKTESLQICKMVCKVNKKKQNNTKIYSTNQEYDVEDVINEEAQEINLSFNIKLREDKNKLILSKSYIEGEIPTLNGYNPNKVELVGNNINYNYDEITRKFTAEKTATLDENGIIKNNAYSIIDSKNSEIYRENEYKLNITYPLDAYLSLGKETIELNIPIKAYYEGYNNPNDEFENPYQSNIASDNIVLTFKKPDGDVAIFEVRVGNYLQRPTKRYVVSKKNVLNLYNGIFSDKSDTYIVEWRGYTGRGGKSNGMTMKETKVGECQVSDQFIKADSTQESMENLTTNIGIYFSNPINLLGEDGEIRVYDDETNALIETFNKNNWNSYSVENPYKYETPVKHIRVETSATNVNSNLRVYNVKELDDDYITENYTREEFNNLKYIKS